MKKYRYFLVLLSMMIFSQLQASVYPDYYQSVSISDYLYTPDGGGGGGITISNDVLTVSFGGSWSTPQYLKMGVIITLSVYPSLPDMELGQILTSSGFYAGFSAKIQNNSLVIYMGGSPSSMTNCSLSFTKNLGCTSSTWYADNDLDGLGDPLNSVTQCTQPAGNWVLDNTDNCPLVAGTSANCASLAGVSPSQDQNYIVNTTYKVQTTTAIVAPTINQANQNITYFDGLGRPMQNVAVRAGGANQDIITHIDYDAFGRQAKDYLPYTSTTGSGSYRVSALSATNSFYDTAKYEPDFPGMTTATINPYSEKLFESSPLNRILQQAAPGASWKLGTGHEIKFDYQTNVPGEVKLYTATAIWNATSGLFNTSLVNGAGTVFYGANQLYKTITYDENSAAIPNETNGSTVEFKNKQGQVVLKRTYNAGVKHDTYYVYDDYGNLTYVIPPKADIAITTAILDELCYQYKYDSRNRLAEKKVPGKQWEFIVYDKLDRPIATGPAFSPFTSPTGNGWSITKYDAFNRPVISAWMPATVTSAGRIALQDARNAETTYFSETKIATTANTTINGIAFRYTNAVFPQSGYHVLSVSYYDDYNFPNAPTIPGTVEGQTVYYNNTIKPKGLPTGSWTRVLETSTLYKNENAYTLYDYKARAIRSYAQNYLGGYTYVDSKLDFTGKPEYTVTKHKLLGTSTELTTKEEFAYTDQGRLLTQTHQINGGVKQLIAKNDYDELGQLISKKVGGTDITGATGLQTVDYAYNVRGWLKQINNPASLGTDLFGFKLNYNTTEMGLSGVQPLYNGNISETIWRTAHTQDSYSQRKRGYGYQYDDLNRLTAGNFRRGNSAGSLFNEETTHYNVTGITYDKNGNIGKLNRRGVVNSSNGIGDMDKLDYFYLSNSNKLMAVQELTGGSSSYGFINGSTAGTEYSYDLNGNLTSDANKGITSVLYNHLNMPSEIKFNGSNTQKINYTYSADGIKLRKATNNGGIISTTDYADSFVYENNILKQFYQPEGYVEPKGSSWQYVYQYKDIWGNTRITYADDNNSGSVTSSEIRREQNYYPFGLEHKGYNTSSYGVRNNLKTYQGQEFTEDLGLNTHEWKYRMSDPSIGKFWQIDPLAEDYMYNSTYAFQENKMGMGTELEGKELDPFGSVRTTSYYSSKFVGKTIQIAKDVNTFLKTGGGGFHFTSKNGGNGDPGRQGGRDTEIVDADGFIQAGGYAKTGSTVGPKQNPKDYGDDIMNVVTIMGNTIDGMEIGKKIVDQSQNVIEAKAKYPTGEVEKEGNFRTYYVKDSTATFKTQQEADNFKKQGEIEMKKLQKTHENEE